jgi:hypothetical protein
MKYRKKPVVIEAVKVTAADYNGGWDDGSPFSEIPEWLKDALETGRVKVHPCDADYAEWDIYTLEGVMRATPDDYIIRGIKGELYPCKADIFAATYEEAGE